MCVRHRRVHHQGAAQNLLMLRVTVVMRCGQLLTFMVKLGVELLTKMGGKPMKILQAKENVMPKTMPTLLLRMAPPF